jgi:hypothetical protein
MTFDCDDFANGILSTRFVSFVALEVNASNCVLGHSLTRVMKYGEATCSALINSGANLARHSVDRHSKLFHPVWRISTTTAQITSPIGGSPE